MFGILIRTQGLDFFSHDPYNINLLARHPSSSRQLLGLGTPWVTAGLRACSWVYEICSSKEL